MSQISILGCGWLGFPLANKLIEIGYSIKGSTTSAEKLPQLQNATISPFEIVLSSNGISGDIAGFLKDSETLIIDIPPRLRSDQVENFVSKISLLLPWIERSSVQNVLFVSSTSVYGGSDPIFVNEQTALSPDTESGRQLIAVEELLRNNARFKTTIVRFGGLLGDDRHPVFHLSGKSGIENPKAPINLIHQIDCIGIIAAILNRNSWDETFNAVAPFHPTREDYYTRKAFEFGLTPPVFKSQESSGKTISSGKIISILDYRFRVTETL